MGKIAFDVPQVREGGFYPQALEKGLRSERALKLALAEMYIQGVSTRKVAAITQQLCGFDVSSSQVSQATAALDGQLQAWREIKYLYLDAHYEKVRQDGQVRDAAVLKASGVNTEGKREVLGVSVSLSEAEPHWRTFLTRLVDRGLRGVELITSDAHAGLASARRAVFGGVPWQRCQFHLQQNAQEAERLLAITVRKYQAIASRLSHWLEENILEGLTVFSFPASHRRLIRTTNGLERLTREIRRRSRVVGIFPNEASCLRLVTAVVSEISDEWLTNRIYLSPHAT